MAKASVIELEERKKRLKRRDAREELEDFKGDKEDVGEARIVEAIKPASSIAAKAGVVNRLLGALGFGKGS